MSGSLMSGSERTSPSAVATRSGSQSDTPELGRGRCVQRDGGVHVPVRRLARALAGFGESTAVERFGILRLQPQGIGEVGDRLVEFLAAQIEQPAPFEGSCRVPAAQCMIAIR